MEFRSDAGPLFGQVADLLRREISVLPPGSRLETDAAMARRLSVSTSVVREALSRLSWEGLVTRHVGRGTYVAQRRMQKPVAILCDLDVAALPRPHSILFRVQEAKRQIEAIGRETVIYLGNRVPSSEPPETLSATQFLKDLPTGRFGGVLSVWGCPHPSWTNGLDAAGIPLVGVGVLHQNMVSHDFEALIKLALRELKKRGRKQIAYLNAVAEWGLQGHDLERLRNVMEWFREDGVEVRPSWFCQEWHSSVKGAGWTSFREIWTGGEEKPDGLILGGPHLWSDVQLAMESLNLEISEDLDVVLPREAVSLPYWRSDRAIQVLFDSKKMMDRAVELLLGLMEGRRDLATRQLINAWSVLESTDPRASDPPYGEVPDAFSESRRT